MDLAEIDDAKPELRSQTLGISLCSDGVWDNWKFEEVARFVLDAPHVTAAEAARSAQAAAVALMDANLKRAQKNFGSSADNMTAVVAYLLPRA